MEQAMHFMRLSAIYKTIAAIQGFTHVKYTSKLEGSRF